MTEDIISEEVPVENPTDMTIGPLDEPTGDSLSVTQEMEALRRQLHESQAAYKGLQRSIQKREKPVETSHASEPDPAQAEYTKQANALWDHVNQDSVSAKLKPGEKKLIQLSLALGDLDEAGKIIAEAESRGKPESAHIVEDRIRTEERQRLYEEHNLLKTDRLIPSGGRRKGFGEVNHDFASGKVSVEDFLKSAKESGIV